MLTTAQIDSFKMKLQTKMLEVAFDQAKAELNDDYECAKELQCLYRFLTLYRSVFFSSLNNYTSNEIETIIAIVTAEGNISEVVPVSFTSLTPINYTGNHVHTIPQVIGLEDRLNALEADIDYVLQQATSIYIIEGGSADNNDFHPSVRD